MRWVLAHYQLLLGRQVPIYRGNGREHLYVNPYFKEADPMDLYTMTDQTEEVAQEAAETIRSFGFMDKIKQTAVSVWRDRLDREPTNVELWRVFELLNESK